MANAFAGIAAKAYDASSAWSNPAGMIRLGRSEIDQGAQYFDPGIRFHGQDLVNGVPVRGGNGGDAAPAAVTGGFEGVWRYSHDLAFGLAVEAPFGLRTSYPRSFVGRYQALVSAIEDFQVALVAGYRVTPRLSIGGGPVVSYLRARLSQAINVSAFAPGAGDPSIDIRGDDYKVGYHLGALYAFDGGPRFGIDYRSRIGQNVTGKQQAGVPGALRVASPLVTGVLLGLDQKVQAQIALPDVLTLSGYYDIDREWAVLATAQWTHWSLIRTLTVQTPTRVEATPIGFRSTWMESVGANWRPGFFPALMLQGGVLYDPGANTGATRGARLPDEDRIGVSGGFSYHLGSLTQFRAAYLHEFAAGGNTIRYYNGFPAAGTITGTFANNADVVSIGFAVGF